MAAEIHTDFPERFAERKRMFALAADGVRRELQLEESWTHKGRIILKFAGVDSISQAEELAQAEIQIPAAERAELEPGAVYISDLAGCAVIVAGAEIGQVADVQFGAGEAPLLVVRGRGDKEYLIPFAEAYLKSVDVAERRIVMDLPEGMLELDVPLSREEKDLQSRGE